MTLIEGVMHLITRSPGHTCYFKHFFSSFRGERLCDKCNVIVRRHWFAGTLFMNRRVAWRR